MLILTKNSTNNIIVTLTENQTQIPTIFLFEFISQQSDVRYYFTAVDTSLYPERYNRFTVYEMVNADTLAGEIELGLDGLYDYTIYQTSLTSLSGLTSAIDMIPYIIDPILEVGLVKLISNDTTNNTEYTPSDSGDNIIYSPVN